MLLQLLKNKFSAHNERSTKALKNIFLSFIYKGGNMLINLLLVPLTINFVSPEEYGIWLTLSSIIAWFAISDIGFGNGLRNKFAEAVAVDNTELARSYVSTTYFSVGILMIILWMLFFVFNNFADWTEILNTKAWLAQELQICVLIVVTFFVLQFLFKLVGTVLIANQQPGKSAGFDFYANILIYLSILVLIRLKIEGSLIILAFVSGIFQLVVFIVASIYFYTHSLKKYRPSYKYYNREYIKEILSLGIKFFVIQFAAILVFQSINIIIAQILGPKTVTVYNIAYRYYTIPLSLSSIVMAPLWTAFTDSYVKRDFGWMKRMIKNVFTLNILFIFILVSMYIFRDYFIKLWIGDDVKVSDGISLSMLMVTIFQIISSSLMILINGIGKIKFQFIIYLFFVPIFIPLASLFGRIYDLEGIIYCLAVVYLLYSILFSIQLYLIINEKARGIFNK